MNKTTFYAAGGLILLFGALQLVPAEVTNPPVDQEPLWDSVRTAELVKVACYDCHSNEVVVPWYGKVAPVSWLVKHDIDEGRAELNFSQMNRPPEEPDEVGESVLTGEMPPRMYLWMHKAARLTESERKTLAKGLDATLHVGEETLRSGLD